MKSAAEPSRQQTSDRLKLPATVGYHRMIAVWAGGKVKRPPTSVAKREAVEDFKIFCSFDQRLP